MTEFIYVKIRGDPDPYKISKSYEREVRAGLLKWEEMSEEFYTPISDSFEAGVKK